MEEIVPGIFKVLPTTVTSTKCVSFFVERDGGNLLFPCFSGHATIEGSFDEIERRGGVSKQLLGDSHFKTPFCDVVARRFDAPLYCSETEAPDVMRSVRNVVTFPFEHRRLESGVEVIPTPGHRPGGVCYLVEHRGGTYLFTGDTIWHDGDAWKSFPTRAGRAQMIQSLNTIAGLDFDMIIANTQARNPICSATIDSKNRQAFIDSILERL